MARNLAIYGNLKQPHLPSLDANVTSLMDQEDFENMRHAESLSSIGTPLILKGLSMLPLCGYTTTEVIDVRTSISFTDVSKRHTLNSDSDDSEVTQPRARKRPRSKFTSGLIGGRSSAAAGPNAAFVYNELLCIKPPLLDTPDSFQVPLRQEMNSGNAKVKFVSQSHDRRPAGPKSASVTTLSSRQFLKFEPNRLVLKRLGIYNNSNKTDASS
ncbi:hypothetical protein CANCADRAFT_44773 [Tortispora caseinolytica NRRL Y-17796]|uniref:Uncharacterized protein n=1 Tax=Tortispora caseinolytica NRRL Y-17796 TaxID=767744 RepID=A0A1E4THC8_9ASCO|nr:hypothetical protein CANCADRAFT_44773 [Tortispora caseinolytica NRRL Y-17796]